MSASENLIVAENLVQSYCVQTLNPGKVRAVEGSVAGHGAFDGIGINVRALAVQHRFVTKTNVSLPTRTYLAGGQAKITLRHLRHLRQNGRKPRVRNE